MRRQVGRSRQRQRGSETERRRGGDTWMGTRQVFCRGPMRDFGLYPYRPTCCGGRVVRVYFIALMLIYRWSAAIVKIFASRQNRPSAARRARPDRRRWKLFRREEQQARFPAIRALFSPVARDRDLSFCATGMACCMSLPGREQSEPAWVAVRGSSCENSPGDWHGSDRVRDDQCALNSLDWTGGRTHTQPCSARPDPSRFDTGHNCLCR